MQTLLRRTRAASFLAAFLALATTSCGGNGSGTGPAPKAPDTSPNDEFALPPLEAPSDCPKPSRELEISNHGASWAGENGKPVAELERCLTVPAGKAFTITLHNRKVKGVLPLQHNVSVYADETAFDEIFRGKYIRPGKSATYELAAMEEGVYLFRCDLHVLNMKGILLVR